MTERDTFEGLSLGHDLKSLRQELNPHLGRTKGACLPLTLRRRNRNTVETVGFEPTSPSLQARCSAGLSYIPRRDPNGLDRCEVKKGGRPTGFEPVPRVSRPRMLPLHHSHHETGTAGLEPAAYRLTSERSPSELRPHRIEWRGWDSNPRSRAHEAREDSRSSTALERRSCRQ